MASDASTAPLDPLDFHGLEQVVREGAMDRLLASWAAVVDVTPARRLVLTALRLDLALLVREPSLLFPCLYNRLVWYDELRAAIEVWREARRTDGSAGSWARVLRPPVYGLTGPLREEYREDLGTGGALRFSDDGQILGVVKEDGRAVAWTRASGRRLAESEARRLLAVPSPRHGRIRARDRRTEEALAAEVASDTGFTFGLIAELPDDGELLAAGSDFENQGAVCRVRGHVGRFMRRRPSIRWCARLDDRARALAHDRAGNLVAVLGDMQVSLLDGMSGAVLVSVPLRAEGLALSPGGSQLATRHGDLVRVWDVAALQRGLQVAMQGHDRGWVAAAFSPDGTRLLTGDLLCDGRDGRIIDRLALDGPGYLEGGPPYRGRRLVDRRLVEMAPLSGVRVWDAADGRLLVEDRKRRHSMSDDITIDPDGTFYVQGRFFGGPAELLVRRVDDGEILGKLGPAGPDLVVFTPDGRRLLTAAGPQLTVWTFPALAREADLAHSGNVSALAVAHDGSHVVTATEDGVLHLWDRQRAELRRTRTVAGVRPPWAPNRDELPELARDLGFAAHAHPWAARRRGGIVEIVAGEQVVARVVTHEPLIADPTGTRWASRTDHVVLTDLPKEVAFPDA